MIRSFIFAQLNLASVGPPLPEIRFCARPLGWCLVVFMLMCGNGCNRGFYRRTADRDAYCLVQEKGAGATWEVGPDYSIDPDARSRFYDPTCATDPNLPIPAPQLYKYQVPILATAAPAERDLRSAQTRAAEAASEASANQNANEPGNPSSNTPGNIDAANPAMELPPELSVPTPEPIGTPPIEQSSIGAANNLGQAFKVRSLDPPASTTASTPTVVTASARRQANQVVAASPMATDLPVDVPTAHDSESSETVDAPEAVEDDVDELLEPLGQTPLPQLGPVPQEAWRSLPESCLKRMLEFESVRDEYERSFERAVDESQLDAAERVNLENILELAMINSREYQAQKEVLYRAALRLSLQRFDYDLKFLSRGNGTSLGYVHDRNNGIEVNRLSTGTGLGITRSLYTGGDLIARFANDVVLTFNGPSGFSSSVGSELLVDFFQPIMQRDVRFEPLIQAERDVVYAARDYVRFRKTLFRDLADQYYSLLLTYRGISINTQDYFSNLREFNRAAATERAGRIPLFQVDQIEQNVLRSRGNLINSCNSLEGAIDRLKVRIGLPTELPLNVALGELEELTLRDEASVLREQLSRKSRVLQQKREREGNAGAISALTEVARRLLSLAEVNARIGEANESQIADLETLVALLEAQEARIEAGDAELMLEKNALAGDEEAQVLPAQLFIRSKEVVKLTLESIRKELLLLKSASRSSEASDADAMRSLVEQWDQRVSSYKELDEELAGVPFAEQAALLPKLITKAEKQLATAKLLEREIHRALDSLGIQMVEDQADLDGLVNVVLDMRTQVPGGTGLAALDVDMDEAMLTALVQRLDLMTTRGELADQWRLIKYAGDDLKSILNLRASQSIRTAPGSGDPFDFSFKDSTTRLSMDFDTPLNRRAERNVFRVALINYNVSLRNLIAAQDNVKLGIRNDLRAIELDRNQYDIAVASAALAYDRVTSTRMQVALGQGNVSARDFLEAQQAYTQSLSSVAQQHIGYILDRIQFFLDLEQLQVDPLNFWADLRNEDYQFLPNTDFPSTVLNGYDTLPCGPWYSRCLSRMEQVPNGQSAIQKAVSLPPPPER